MDFEIAMKKIITWGEKWICKFRPKGKKINKNKTVQTLWGPLQ